jgi:hypothetical protein
VPTFTISVRQADLDALRDDPAPELADPRSYVSHTYQAAARVMSSCFRAMSIDVPAPSIPEPGQRFTVEGHPGWYVRIDPISMLLNEVEGDHLVAALDDKGLLALFTEADIFDVEV